MSFEVKTYYRDESRPLGLTVLKRSDRDRFYLAGRGWSNTEVAMSRIQTILPWARRALQDHQPLKVMGEFEPQLISGGDPIEIHRDDMLAFIEALEKLEADL